MVEWLKKHLEIFNLAGGVIMGIWTLNVILMCWVLPLAGKTIDGSVVALYGIAVTAFATSKTVVKVKKG